MMESEGATFMSEFDWESYCDADEPETSVAKAQSASHHFSFPTIWGYLAPAWHDGNLLKLHEMHQQ